MENTRSKKKEMDGEVLISRQSRHFCFIDNMIKVLFPVCALVCRVNNYVCRQGEGINGRKQSTISIINNC